MKNNENKDAAPDTVSAGDQQNRREFFNGLGKWSMIVVAAVSFLRGSVTPAHAGSEGHKGPNGNHRRLAFRGSWRKSIVSTLIYRVVTVTRRIRTFPT